MKLYNASITNNLLLVLMRRARRC